MKILADTHLHFYPCHDLRRAFDTLASNLNALAGGATGVRRLGFLAERHDCTMHADLLSGRLAPGGGWEAAPAADGRALCLRRPATGPSSEVYLLPGRQLVTRERLEILALALEDRLPDGLPAAEAVEATLARGGVPVLAWAPGKWLFQRGRVVRKLIDRFAGGALLIGDTTLRPTIWAEPLLMRAARRRGCRVIAGSDPLPMAGEESMPGAYASVLEGAFDPARALRSAARLLRDSPRADVAGHRGTLGQVLRRLRKLRQAAG